MGMFNKLPLPISTVFLRFFLNTLLKVDSIYQTGALDWLFYQFYRVLDHFFFI